MHFRFSYNHCRGNTCRVIVWMKLTSLSASDPTGGTNFKCRRQELKFAASGWTYFEVGSLPTVTKYREIRSFLDASTDLYKRIYPSVRWSVRLALFLIAEIEKSDEFDRSDKSNKPAYLTNPTESDKSDKSDASLFERTCFYDNVTRNMWNRTW